MTIEKICVTFENCETVTIPSRYLLDFYMNELETFIHRAAVNAITKETVARCVVLHIDRMFNVVCKERFYDCTSAFERFKKYPDISCITVFYEREHNDDRQIQETFLVDWDTIEDMPEYEENGINPNQKMLDDADGGLAICIAYDDEFQALTRKQIESLDAIDITTMRLLSGIGNRPSNKESKNREEM